MERTRHRTPEACAAYNLGSVPCKAGKGCLLDKRIISSVLYSMGLCGAGLGIRAGLITGPLKQLTALNGGVSRKMHSDERFLQAAYALGFQLMMFCDRRQRLMACCSPCNCQLISCIVVGPNSARE